METFIYKVWVTLMTLTVAPNCPAEDGLHCLQYSVKKVEAVSTEDRKAATEKLSVFRQIVESDTLVKHVRYAQVFLGVELDSVPKTSKE